MKILDWLCAIVVLALGIVHCALMPVIYHPFSMLAIWSLGTGFSFVFAGMLNVLRLKGPGSPLLHLFSVIANAGGLLVGVLLAGVLVAIKVKLAHNPQVIVLLIAFAGEFLFSLARRR